VFEFVEAIETGRIVNAVSIWITTELLQSRRI